MNLTEDGATEINQIASFNELLGFGTDDCRT